MSRYNEILVGRVGRGVQKLFGVKGEVPVASLAGELQIVHMLHTGPETWYLEGWNQFNVGRFLGASAGNANAHQLRNPSSSGVIAVIQKIYTQADNVAIVRMVGSAGAVSTDLTNVIALGASRLDPRGNPTPSLVYSEQQVAAPTDLTDTLFFASVGLSAGAIANYDYIVTDAQQFPLLPGDGIKIRNNAVNTQNFIGIMWLERPIEDSEVK